MFHKIGDRKPVYASWWTLIALVVLLASLVSCSKPEKPVANEAPASSQAGPKTFATPEDGGKALLAAAKAGDRDALLAIFGQQSKDLIFSGDAAQDKLSFERFTDAYQTMNRWRKQTDGSEVLYLGADNNPFPIPLKKNGAGQWYFDTAAGKDEILARRIGDNELSVMGVLAAMGDAQTEYLSQAHDGVKQYAQKRVSDDGRQNGLYWKSPEGQPQESAGAAGGVCCRDRRIHSGSGQAAAVSRLLLWHSYQTGRRRQRRCEKLHREWKDDRGLCLHCLSGEVR